MNRKATLSSLVGIIATTLLLTVLSASVAQAQPKAFAENFNSNALPATTLEESGGSPLYAGGVVIFPGAFNGDRRYLRTLANYDTTSFTAEVTVTVSSPFIEPHIGFIGFGAGVPSAFFGEPMTAPNIYVRVTPTGFASTVAVTNGTVEDVVSAPGAAGDGTHRVRITWNRLTKVFTVAFHKNYAGGPFVPTTTLAPVVATDTFGPTDSRIFFGGHGVTFDDLVVLVSLTLAGTPGEKNCHGNSVSDLALTQGSIENAALVFGFPSVDALQDHIKSYCRID